jgi:phosphoglycerate dehydrogenase-like enzyme
MLTLLVTVPMTEPQKETFATIIPDSTITFSSFGKVTPGMVCASDIIIGNIPTNLLKHIESVQWMQLYSSGATGYSQGLPAHTVLTCATGAYGPAVAEHLLALLLSVAKHVPLYRDAQTKREWITPVESFFISGKRVLVVGAGDIGSTFARYVGALGAHVVGIRRTPVGHMEGFEAVHTLDKLDGMLPHADIVAITLPGTDETTHLFDLKRLLLMKRNAILLNVGRGNVIDTNSLEALLREGHLGAVGLDVFEEEPLASSNPLWTAPRLLITPHAAGGLLVGETREKVIALCRENLRRFRDGAPLLNIVDRNTGYKESL